MPGRVSIGDGTYGTVSHVSVSGGPWRPVTKITAQDGSVVPPPPPPPPPVGRRMGYHGKTDQNHITLFGGPPEVASDYYQVGNGNVNGGTYTTILTDQRPRLARGTDIVMFLSYKGYFGGDVNNRSLTALNVGPSDPDYAAVSAITVKFATMLNTLKTEYPARRIVAVIEGEVEAKAYKFLSGTTGQVINVQSYVDAGQGLDEAYRIIQANSDGVDICLSFATTRTNEMRTIAQQITPGRCTYIGFDPYTNHATQETMLKCFNDIVKWWRAEQVAVTLGNLPVVINETGMQTDSHTDTQIAHYITPSATYTMRNTMADANVDWAIYFDSSADLGHEFTDGAHPLAVQAWKDSYQSGTPVTPVGPGVSSINAGLTSLGNPDGTGTVTETSGLVVSKKNTTGGPVIWIMDDSGGANAIYAIDTVTGTGILGTWTLSGSTNSDWEDLAWQKLSGTDYIVVGDIGSANSNPKSFWRVPEPSVTAGVVTGAHTIAAGSVEQFTFTLPTASGSIDSEGYFIDPITNDFFIFSKRTQAVRPFSSNFYRIAAAQFTPGGATGMAITTPGTVQSHRATTNDAGITWADISQDGTVIIWGNLQEMWLVNRDVANGETVSQALLRAPLGDRYRFWDPAGASTLGSESVGMDAGNSPAGFYSRVEGAAAVLKRGTFVY